MADHDRRGARFVFDSVMPAMRRLALTTALWLVACAPDAPGPDAPVRDAPTPDAPAADTAGLDAPSALDVGEEDAGQDASMADAPSAGPTLGAAAIVQRTYASGPLTGSLPTPSMATETGSVLVASIARGSWSNAPTAPGDSLGNVFGVVDGPRTYRSWPTSATALYAARAIAGGADHVVSAEWGEGGGAGDEITLTVIEVRGASDVVDDGFVERDAGEALTSAPVTTTGPALLVAIWWGTGGVRPRGTRHVAVPEAGFERVEAATGLVSLSDSGYIQCAVATRAVGAGEHTITWTSDGEGAQLYLVALE